MREREREKEEGSKLNVKIDIRNDRSEQEVTTERMRNENASNWRQVSCKFR
jgi:hypothetical protein